jgi:mono/diheme cytochrome c family protein
MKIQSVPVLFSFIFLMVCIPGFLKAQGNHDANHCAVQKSPYRISLDSGKVIYAKQCLSCHQADGLGVSNMNPPLNTKQVSGNKDILIGMVIKGISTHQEIEGKTYQNVMPAHPEMSDREIADVLTYIRNSFGNKATAVKISEVKSTRGKMN